MRTTVHLACALTLGVCSVAQPAQAKPAVWMEGTWSLDAQSSTSLDPVLQAMGYGWIARKVMSSLAVKQVIRATRRGISFRVITRFTDEAIVLPVDNRWAIGKNLDGGTTERRSRWLGKGDTLLTEDRFPQGLMTTARRRISDVVFHEEVTFKAPGKAPVRAVRVFRRQRGSDGR